MTVIVCVDDRLGTMFNNRRQSKDSILIKRISEMVRGSRLVMTPYSEKQFAEDNIDITISDNPLETAQPGDYCFVEGNPISEYLDKISRIVLYKWNKAYPYDQTLDVNLSTWELTSTIDFEGSSHEKITEEIYKNEKY